MIINFDFSKNVDLIKNVLTKVFVTFDKHYGKVSIHIKGCKFVSFYNTLFLILLMNFL